MGGRRWSAISQKIDQLINLQPLSRIPRRISCSRFCVISFWKCSVTLAPPCISKYSHLTLFNYTSVHFSISTGMYVDGAISPTWWLQCRPALPNNAWGSITGCQLIISQFLFLNFSAMRLQNFKCCSPIERCTFPICCVKNQPLWSRPLWVIKATTTKVKISLCCQL